jgi:hypothetical protein
MGVETARQIEKRYRARVPRGLCHVHHGEETGNVRPVQPGPKGKDEEDRLPQTGGQGNISVSANGECHN